MFMQGKKKLKICDFDGVKIDSAVISSPADADKVILRWKKKGLF